MRHFLDRFREQPLEGGSFHDLRRPLLVGVGEVTQQVAAILLRAGVFQTTESQTAYLGKPILIVRYR